MDQNKDKIYFYIAILIFFSFLIGVFLNFEKLSFFNIFIVFIYIMEMGFDVISLSFKFIKRIFNSFFGGPLVYLVLYPFVYSIGLSLWLILYTGKDWKEMLIGVFDIYITIGTIILSVAFVMISIIVVLQKKSQNTIQLKKAKSFQYTSIICGYSILGIFITLVMVILISFSSGDRIGFGSTFGFAISSFFILGSIFGTFSLSQSLFNEWSKNESNSGDEKFEE